MNVLRYAWRNLWRNSRRTGITLTAVTLTTVILIVFYALMEGWLGQSVSNATNMVVGEAQVHALEYLEDRSFFKSLEAPDKVLAAAKARGIGAAARSYGYGLVSVGTKSAGAVFWGIDPAVEKTTFDLAEQVDQGRFLPDRAVQGMILGRKLARSLNASVGSEIIVVVQAADGSLGNELYAVTGILKTIGDTIDRSAAILHRADFEELFVSGGRIHEIALNSRGRYPLEELAAEMRAALPGVDIKTWRELMPTLSDMVNLFDGAMAIFGAIFFLAGGLGVMNTMLMATYERMHEFGILKALGTSPWRIVGNMTVEALILAVIATGLGTVIGLICIYFLMEFGIDIRKFGVSSPFPGWPSIPSGGRL